MTCLCFSDSHGVTRHIKAALSRHKDAEVVFFLGDGVNDIIDLAEADIGRRTWICVRGNCDAEKAMPYREVKEVETVTLEGKKIVLTHGDRYGVNYGYGGVLALAGGLSADILLHGHTHISGEKYFSDCGVYVLNPGTAGGIRADASYGVLTVTTAGVLFSVINCEQI